MNDQHAAIWLTSEVIPCCVDFERFRTAEALSRTSIRQALHLTDRRVIVYVGSLGGTYMTNEMIEFFVFAHRQDPTVFALILTQNPQESIRQRLRASGLGNADFLVDTVPFDDIPRYLKAADIAISFVKACYARRSASLTEIPEYLAGGLPIVCTAGVGDLDELIEEERVGALIRAFTPQDYAQALAAAERLRQDATFPQHCRKVAYARFDLAQVGGLKYRRL